jgi:hypothetical protein
MKRIIYGVGFAGVLAGATLTAVLATASSGDAIYVLMMSEPEQLGQVGLLGQAVNATWPEIGAAKLDGAECSQPKLNGPMWCRAWRLHQVAELTDEQYLRAAVDNALGDPKPEAVILKYTKPKKLSETEAAFWETYVSAVYDTELALMFEFVVQRDPKTPTIINHSASTIVTRSPTQFRADREAGLVRFLIGVVE